MPPPDACLVTVSIVRVYLRMRGDTIRENLNRPMLARLGLHPPELFRRVRRRAVVWKVNWRHQSEKPAYSSIGHLDRVALDHRKRVRLRINRIRRFIGGHLVGFIRGGSRTPRGDI